MNLSILPTFLTCLGKIRYRGSPHEFHENRCHDIHTLLRGVKFCTYFLHLLPYLGEKKSVWEVSKKLYQVVVKTILYLGI